MNDQTQWLINVLGGILVAILGWIGVRLHQRMDSFDKELMQKVDKGDFKELIKEVKVEFHSSMNRQTKLLVRLFKGSSHSG